MAKSKAKKPAAKKLSAKKPVAKKFAAKKPAAKKNAAKKPAAKKIAKTSTNKTAKPAAKKATPTALEKNVNWQKYLTPLDDRLIVQLEKGVKMTAGGLYIPDTVEAAGNFRGKVLAVGRGHLNKKGHTRPMDVKAGDMILFSEQAGTKTSLEGFDVKILRESEVLGIVLKN